MIANLLQLLNGDDPGGRCWGWWGGAQQGFAHCFVLNKDLKQSLERLIAEAKQQLAARGPIRW